jgi:hypothetical protein
VKKLGICVLSLFVLMALAPLSASADLYVTNTTQVKPYQGSVASNYYGVSWVDNIPTGNSLFKIYGYEIGKTGATGSGDVALNIFTNMPQGGDPDTSIPSALYPLRVGNLFLNLGGAGFTQALVLPNSGTTATLYDITGFTTSKDLWSPYSNWVYGGEYRTSSSSASSGNVPVKATGATATTTYNNDPDDPTSFLGRSITATWMTNPTTHPGTYELSIVFPGLDGNNSNDIVFLWASGTCANGVIFGSHESPISPPGVPVPPSALLLGSGLLGLAILRYRRVGR